MGFKCRILADSKMPSGTRLTTLEITFPRSILAELNTHRMASKNAASSRAIPVWKMIKNIIADPFIPVFARNQKGMQSAEPLVGWRLWLARKLWLIGMHICIFIAKCFIKLDIHKQFANRILEPWMWCTVIISATEWDNLLALRCHPKAEPSFQVIANMILQELVTHEPTELEVGEWHRPLIYEQDTAEVKEYVTRFNNQEAKRLLAESGLPTTGSIRYDYKPADPLFGFDERLNKISVGRCARISYLTHEGNRDHEKDIQLHDLLTSERPGHWSPTEHVALAADVPANFHSGNFRGCVQYRKTFKDENINEFIPSLENL